MFSRTKSRSCRPLASRHHSDYKLRNLRTALLFLVFAMRAAAWDSGAVGRLMKDSREVEGADFSAIVMAATGHRILPIDREKDAAWLGLVGSAMDATLADLNSPSHPIHQAGRINEASRFIEEALMERLAKVPGWKCTIPPTASGGSQRSGYPDLRLVLDDGSVVYLDPKLYAGDSRESSFRTFYYEPKAETNKITDDARHLLVGVAHRSGADGRPEFLRWELVDVAAMPVRLKLEFQSSNRDIYRDSAILGSGVGER